MFQFVDKTAQIFGHLVKAFGKLGQFIPGKRLNTALEITLGHFLCGCQQTGDRLGDGSFTDDQGSQGDGGNNENREGNDT